MDKSNLPPFSCTIYWNPCEFYIRIEGDFRAGTHLEALKASVQALIAATGYKPILDLSQIIYWDSDGMNYAKAFMANGSVKLPYNKLCREYYNVKFGLPAGTNTVYAKEQP